MRCFAEAEKTGRELLEAQRRVLGPDHKYTLVTRNNLGHFAEAETAEGNGITALQLRRERQRARGALQRRA